MALHIRLGNKIRELQTKHRELCPRDDLRFHLTEDYITTAIENRLQNWLYLYEDLINIQVQLRIHANYTNQTLVTDYFRPVRPNSS